MRGTASLAESGSQHITCCLVTWGRGASVFSAVEGGRWGCPVLSTCCFEVRSAHIGPLRAHSTLTRQEVVIRPTAAPCLLLEATSDAVPPLSPGLGECRVLLWAFPGRWPQVLSPVRNSALCRPSAGAVRTSRGPWTSRALGMTTPSPMTSWTTSTLGRAPATLSRNRALRQPCGSAQMSPWQCPPPPQCCPPWTSSLWAPRLKSSPLSAPPRSQPPAPHW